MGKEQFEEMDEEMTVELELDDGTNVTCAIITILEVEGKDYIVLMPLDENGQNDDGEVWFYRYSENPNDPNEEPQLDYIDDDAEYEKVEEAFDEYLDSCEFDELVTLDGEANEQKRNQKNCRTGAFPYRKCSGRQFFLSYRKLRFHTIKMLREDAHSAQG